MLLLTTGNAGDGSIGMQRVDAAGVRSGGVVVEARGFFPDARPQPDGGVLVSFTGVESDGFGRGAYVRRVLPSGSRARDPGRGRGLVLDQRHEPRGAGARRGRRRCARGLERGFARRRSRSTSGRGAWPPTARP